MKAIKIFIIIILVVIFQNANSQNYKNTIGFRAGRTSGFCFKTFVNNYQAIEGIESFRDKGIQLTGLIETYTPANFKFNDNMFLYYGFGAHFGYIKKYEQKDIYNIDFETDNTYKTRPVMGVDAIFGIEYRFSQLPIVATVDGKPFTEFFGFPFFRIRPLDIGISLKYSFK